MSKRYSLGLDVGSTTIKAVLLADGAIVHQEYRRHNADVQAELIRLVDDVATSFPGIKIAVAITGSGGLGIAQALDVEFVQEVIAGTFAVQRHYPEADVAIELGGEDAKITYLKPVPEQRMNGTCAGGTGAFIDQMAILLHTDAAGLSISFEVEPAKRHNLLHGLDDIGITLQNEERIAEYEKTHGIA